MDSDYLAQSSWAVERDHFTSFHDHAPIQIPVTSELLTSISVLQQICPTIAVRDWSY